MPYTFALIDTANLFYRATHVAAKQADSFTKAGMALHLCLQSANSAVRQFGVDHVVFALEGRSWRKDFYKPYKANRDVRAAARTEAEVEDHALFTETFADLVQFLTEKTNVSVMRCLNAEADDIIARFIQLHPSDKHIIVSSDTDFYQLISPTVSQYNGITDQTITLEGIFDYRGQRVIDKKTNEPKTIGDPEFILFEKCMRGDPSDHIFSAYPGVRTKGTKNKIGLMEAFADRHEMGWAWNNIMLHEWVDPDSVTHVVRDDYLRNKTLIDLTAQPEHIKQALDETIVQSLKTEPASQVGVQFLRFCGKHELVKISENMTEFGAWLNKVYPMPPMEE